MSTIESGNPNTYEGPTRMKESPHIKAVAIITALFSYFSVLINIVPRAENIYTVG